MKLYQQGDVLLKTTDSIPNEAKKTALKTLKQSDVTGHGHRIVGAALILKQGNTFYVKSTRAFDLKHEEHKTLKIPAGTYIFDEVKEYDHLTEEARAVAD